MAYSKTWAGVMGWGLGLGSWAEFVGHAYVLRNDNNNGSLLIFDIVI